jgi:hypothetical protein
MRCAFPILILTVLVTAACSSQDKARSESRIAPATQPSDRVGPMAHVVTRDENYYMSSPAQARPLEGKFAKGTKVRLLAQMGSYSKVASENGIIAYVTTGSLDPLK